MAVHQLLLRGMLVGIVAGLLAFGFARVFGEPTVDRAIAFETAQHEAEAAEARRLGQPAPADDPELFSRATQSGIGLLTAVVVYGAALGGLFSLVFAVCYGRVGRFSPRACAALLALAGFVVLYLVPDLKYPANPPSVGEASTIGARTGLYFSMIVVSLVAMLASLSLAQLLAARLGRWNAGIVAGFAFLLMIGIAGVALPPVNEVPQLFPAAVLWRFRLASLGVEAVLWAAIGLLFGAMTERSAARG